MDIEVIEKDDVNMRLIIRDVDVSFMNALRRIIISEVPTMAIDEVVVVENSSMLQDEILAHRLGLIPLKTDLDSYNLPEECPCKSEFGCSLCRVSFALEVEAGEENRTVLSGDLKSENPDIVPVSDKIVIAKLVPDQKLRLEAYARLGRGKDHAKWQPVSMCTYKYLPHVEIDEKTCDACGECVRVCPKRILVKAGNRIEIRNVLDCTLCQDCVDVCRKELSAIKVTWDKNSFVFSMESTGALKSERILKEALDILNKKLGEFTKELKAAKKR